MLASRNSAESAGDPLMVMKLWLIVSGIYIWEFVTTLDFEWSVIRRHRRYRWTIWVYSVSRLSGLAVVILLWVNVYGTSPINCQAWIITGWASSAFGGYGLSSILIMLRIYAIWNKSKVIMAISAAVWAINLGFQLASINKIRAEWVPAARSCAITNVEVCKAFILNMLITDVILLSIMLAGLLRFRLSARGSLYFSQLLRKQGVIWLAVATAAEVPQVLLPYLNVNDAFNQLFLMPAMVATIIAATRMYRSLILSASPPDFHLGKPDSPDVEKAKRLVSHTEDSFVRGGHIPSNRLEVAVHKADAQLADKPQELGLDDTGHSNVEGGDEKQ